MKRIYIAGKVTGLDYDETRMKFGKYAKEIMSQGHTAIVPLEVCNRNDDWKIAMRKCIVALVTCHEIHMLPDWRESKGAQLEQEIAIDLGIPVFYVKEDGTLKERHEVYSRPECSFVYCDDPEDCKKMDCCHYQ